MKRMVYLLTALIGFGFLAAQPSLARNYDCSKAGNANKAVCKQATPAAAPAPSPTASKMPAERHYDCSKAGNANKAVCKGAAAPAATPAPTATSHPSAPAPSARPISAPQAAPSASNPAGPNGATAMCSDGTYSHSAHRSGTCSHHGGVKTWY